MMPQLLHAGDGAGASGESEAMARGLAAAAYLDEGALGRERAAVFAPAWQLVAHTGQLAEPGAYVCVRHIGEPLVLTRDGERVRGFFNVCRHRAGPVALGEGRSARLVCRYHGWSYDLAGRLQRAPEMQPELAREGTPLDLVPVEVAQWGPLVFVRLEARPQTFEDWIGPVRERCAAYGLERLRFAMSRTYVVRANWKVYVENYLEGYHLPAVHPALSRELDFSSYVTEVGAEFVCQHAPIRPQRGGESRAYAPTGSEPDARYFWLHPNLMLNFYQGILQTNVVVPLDATTTQVRFDWFVPAPPADPLADPRFARMLALSEETQAEDAAICEAVQGNFASRAYRPGPYSERFEQGVQRFHELVRRSSG